jgi:hypothetical protein
MGGAAARSHRKRARAHLGFAGDAGSDVIRRRCCGGVPGGCGLV